MAITNPNASYFTNGPAQSGQILADITASQEGAGSLDYFATVTLDGTLTTFTLNFIDGTKTLSFTPRAVTASVVGGTQAATLAPTIVTTTPTNTGVTVNIGAAGTAANTITFAGKIYR